MERTPLAEIWALNDQIWGPFWETCYTCPRDDLGRVVCHSIHLHTPGAEDWLPAEISRLRAWREKHLGSG